MFKKDEKPKTATDIKTEKPQIFSVKTEKPISKVTVKPKTPMPPSLAGTFSCFFL